MRGIQLSRQWRIIRLIESRPQGITAAEISAEMQVPTRTVYRDLDAIHDAGFPVYQERSGKQSYWRLLDGFTKRFQLPITATELMSLHMSRDLLQVFEGTIFQESMESLFAKVKASLPPETLGYLDHISERVKVGFGPSKDYRSFSATISALSRAVAEKKRVEILYKAISTGGETLRRVDPYQVWVMNGSLYLIGHCHLRNEIRTFAMDRIKALTPLDDTFCMPEGFSLDEYLQTAFRVMRGAPEVVKVGFKPGAAQVVKERIWHPSQEIREHEDGGVTVTLEAPINYEIVSWILGFGASARVLEPESLRERIRNELETAVRLYDS